MIQTLIFRTLVMVDDEGHFNSFSIDSQREEICKFVKTNDVQFDRLGMNKEEIDEEILGEDREKYILFIQTRLKQRGVAEINDVRYLITEEDPF